MKLIFAGTPLFAARALAKLLKTPHEIALVLTQPDRPSGRGMKLTPSPVKKLALDNNLEVFQPLSLKENNAQQAIQNVGADLMIVAAYGLILPQAVLDMPPFGCINIHASLLPRWRGAAPIQRAILAGDAKTGICLMQMDKGLDTGAILNVDSLSISPNETAGDLHDKLAEMGADLLIKTLGELPKKAIPQALEGVSYAEKIIKEEAKINWQNDAFKIDTQIRAFNPAPAAFTQFEGAPFKVWRGQIVDKNGQAGHILSADKGELIVACGAQSLRLLEVQKAGGKRVSAADFLSGLNGKSLPIDAFIKEEQND